MHLHPGEYEVDIMNLFRRLRFNKFFFFQYMGTQQTPFVRRQVRKLLLYICGSKEKYRQLRDMHTLDTHMSEVKTLCGRAGLDENGVPIILPYDSLISFVSQFHLN